MGVLEIVVFGVEVHGKGGYGFHCGLLGSFGRSVAAWVFRGLGRVGSLMGRTVCVNCGSGCMKPTLDER